MDYSHWIQRFDVRNHILPTLAAEAALDIDNHIKQKSPEGKSVQYLSDLLNNATQGETPLASYIQANQVLGFAISGKEDFEKYWKGKKVYDVVLQANLVSKDLRDFKTLPSERQEGLRDFCVRLSKAVMRHQTEYYSGSFQFVA